MRLWILLLAHHLTTYTNALSRNVTRTPTRKRDGDRGPDHGSVWIKNSCEYDVYVKSVGAYPKDDDHTEDVITISANSNYTEAYRETCPKPKEHAHMSPPPQCPELNKMEGQAVSFKISNTTEGPENILQLEYTLVQNPERGDDFPRLDYDVSILDCAQIEGISEAMVASDQDLNMKKVNGCPGYQNGLALWFDDHELCRPIYCDGVSYCDAIYNYQRTGKGEDSFACHHEYYGNMYFEMCVGNGDG
jgi:hypothetical protein